MGLYQHFIKPALFRFEAETAHKFTLKMGLAARSRVVQRGMRTLFELNDPRLRVKLPGITFDNPVGMAAGLDKNCTAVELTSSLGFGFLEYGGVTTNQQTGNAGPRVFR